MGFHKQSLIFSNNNESYPRPKSDSSQNFRVCQWNLNSIRVHHFSKLYLLKTYLTANKNEILRLSETYLNHTFPVNDESVATQGYDIAIILSTLSITEFPSTTKALYSWKPFIFIFWKNVSTFTLLLVTRSLNFIDLLINLTMNLNHLYKT